jgi:hypothetical protein
MTLYLVTKAKELTHEKSDLHAGDSVDVVLSPTRSTHATKEGDQG